MKSLRQASAAGRSTAVPRGVRAPKNSISLPPSNLPRLAQAPAPFGHRAHRRASRCRCRSSRCSTRGWFGIRKLVPNGPMTCTLSPTLQVAQVVRADAAHRLALVVLGHALDRQRDVVVAGPLAVARAGDRVLARDDAAGRCASTPGGTMPIDWPSSTGNGMRAEVEHDVVRVVLVAGLGARGSCRPRSRVVGLFGPYRLV